MQAKFLSTIMGIREDCSKTRTRLNVLSRPHKSCKIPHRFELEISDDASIPGLIFLRTKSYNLDSTS